MKYAHAAQARHAFFSPFVVSVDSVMERQAWFTVQQFTDKAFYQMEQAI